MHVDFPVGRVIFNDKMGNILKTAFLNCFIKFSQNSMMKKAESINQGRLGIRALGTWNLI